MLETPPNERAAAAEVDATTLAEDDALWGEALGFVARSAASAVSGAQGGRTGKGYDLSSLNTRQREAVLATEGPVQVVAGAGTGKTKVLTTRIAHIVATSLAAPEEILAVTFTNKAAAEMRERIIAMIGEAGRRVRMGSFHAISLIMLRHHPRAAGLQNDRFMILDEADQRTLIESIAKDAGWGPEVGSTVGGGRKETKEQKEWVQTHQTRLMGWKEEGWTVSDVAALPATQIDLADPEISCTLDLYRAYQDALAARNAVDFADLILHMVRLFREDETIRAYWAAKFKYVLVDEFQDTNPLQNEWLRQLARDHRNICVVGDLDQCIYQWRNARPEIFSAFATAWTGCQLVTVDRNYRSTQQILDVANRVVALGPRVGEKILNSPVSGDPVRFDLYDNHHDEAMAIAQHIQHLQGSGHPLSEIAILLRSAGPMRTFEEQLIRHAIPYTVVGGMKSMEREEVKDALAYLRLAIDPRDEFAFLRIANKPTRNIEESTALRVVESFRSGGFPDLAVACRDVADNAKRIPQGTRMALTQLAELIDEFATMAKDGAGPGKLMLHMLERVAYITWRVQIGDDRVGDREESLKDLCHGADEFADAAAYLQNLTLLSAADVRNTDDQVRLSTIHAAKGLEFDTVFTPCLEEGILPNALSLTTSYGLEEEKRIAHVAWTRPRKTLHISCAKTRYYQPTLPSSFLTEVGLIAADESLPRTGSFAPGKRGVPKAAGPTFMRRRRF